jgi:hypothetical protein
MKALYLLPLLGLLACVSQKPAADAHVSVKDCGHLYHHILEVQVDNVIDSCFVMTPTQREKAMTLLDRQYREDDTLSRFYRYCYQHMTVKQVQCSMSSKTIEGIDSCKVF